jgi:hypothetical protein
MEEVSVTFSMTLKAKHEPMRSNPMRLAALERRAKPLTEKLEAKLT